MLRRKIHQLSASQSKILSHKSGILVSSGAHGNGKTHSAALRLTSIPHSLALSPTNASYQRLQDAVDIVSPIGKMESIGNDMRTLHSFCHDILNDAGFSARVLSRSAMAALLSQHIHSLPLGQFQNVLGREKIVSDFLAFFSSLEALGISQDQYGDFVQQLDNGTMEYEYVKVQRELYEAFKAFRKLCEQQGVTHWNAVVSEALRILDSSPILVDQLVNDFPHIVVDDFSEMTPAMLLVLRKLVKASSLKSLVALSEPHDRLASFFQRIPHQEVALLGCFRSTPEILDVATSLRKGVTSDHKLLGSHVQCAEFANDLEEAEAIATYVATYTDAHPEMNAQILCASEASLTRVTNAMISRGLIDKGGADLFCQPHVRSAVSFLQAIVHPDSSGCLIELAVSPPCNFPQPLLAQLLLPYRQRGRNSVRSALVEFSSLTSSELDTAALQERTKQLLKSIDALSSRVFELSTSQLLVEFLKSQGQFDAIMDPTDETSASASDAFAKLIDVVTTLEEIAETPYVSDILPLLMQYQKFHFVEKDYDSEGSHIRIGRLQRTSNTESDCLVLAGMSDSVFPGRLRRSALPFPIDLALDQYKKVLQCSSKDQDLLPGLRDWIPILAKDHHLDRTATMLYNAVSHAKSELWISFANNSDTRKRPAQKSRFLSHIQASSVAQAVSRNESTDAFECFDAFPDPTAAFPWLSYSQINEFSRCPYQYFLSRVMQFEGQRTPQMVYGSAVHAGVAVINRELRDVNKEHHAAELEKKWLPAFLNSWDESAFESAEQEQCLRRRGLDAIASYGQQVFSTTSVTKKSFVEKPFCVFIPEASIFLKGVWDHVAVTEDETTIVEYKTNPSGKARDLSKFSGAIQQTKLYMLAYSRIFKAECRSSKIQIVETGQALDVEPNPESYQEALDSIIYTAQQIRAKNFQPTPSVLSCSFCPHADRCQHRSTVLLRKS